MMPTKLSSRRPFANIMLAGPLKHTVAKLTRKFNLTLRMQWSGSKLMATMSTNPSPVKQSVLRSPTPFGVCSMKPQVRGYQKGALSSPKRLQTAIDINHGYNSIDLLWKHLAQGSLNRDVAAECLTAFLKRVEILPEEAVKEKIRRIALGKPLMTWLWDQHNEIVHPDDNDLIHGLTYLLVVEGHEELVWDWILANETNKSEDTGLKDAYQWRATAVTSLAMAKSKNLYGGLDDALRVYNRASDFDLNSRVKMPMKPIRAWTDKQLQNSIRELNSVKGLSLPTYIVGTPRYPKTDLGLWEEYQEDFRNQPLSETMKEENLNIMMLYRPVNPDPYPALEALRLATANPSSLRLRYEKPSTLEKIHWQFRRVAGLLRDYGRHSDAEETWQMANARFGVAREGFTESEKPSKHEIAAANAYGEPVKPQKKPYPKWLKQ